jgi:membrane associated rhomboid family serine protease
MSVLERNSPKKALLGEDGSALTGLLIANALVFVALNFVKVIYLLNNLAVPDFMSDIISWIAVPASADMFASRPWTLITYMFSHVRLWHFISTGLWLWGFGFILTQLVGNRKIVPLYIYGGLAGAITFLLTVNLVPGLLENTTGTDQLIGAGPSLMAIAIGTTAFAPRYKIFPLINGGIPLWLFTAVFVVIHIATIGSGIGAAAGYTAGGLMGLLFTWQLKRGNDWGQWMTDLVNWVDDLFNPEKKQQPQSLKNQLFYKTNQKPFEKTPHVTQQRVDDLLDKINQKGYYSLSDEEKEFLEKAAKEDL